MNKEIKEIKHIMICLKEHIALSDDEDNLLLDYITNLQQEINKLTAESTEWESKYYEMQDNFHTANDEIERLNELNVCVGCDNSPSYKQRIDKAIEYIKNDWYSKNTLNIDNVVIGNWRIDLLSILQSGDEDEPK